MANAPRLSATDVPADVEILDAATVYNGYFRLDRYRVRHRRHDGTWSPPLTREVFERGHAVAVLLHDPDTDRVLLVRQFRLPALAAGKAPWQTEIVAGVIEDGEDAAQVARREVREECGQEPGELHLVHHYLVSPGGSTETIRIYVATVDSHGAGGVHGRADEGEDIAVETVPVSRALEMLADGTIENGPAIMALQWLALNRDRPRR